MTGIIDATPPFKPNDPAPEGYIAWHDWAEVQIKAGLRQKQCAFCSLWKFPQELSETVLKSKLQTSRGKTVEVESPVCKDCEPKK